MHPTSSGDFRVPTQVRTAHGAVRFIQDTKAFLARPNRRLLCWSISAEQHIHYKAALTVLLRHVEFIDKQLHAMYILFPEAMLRDLMDIIFCARLQASLLSTPSSSAKPTYILSLKMVHEYTVALQNAKHLSHSMVCWTTTDEGIHHRRIINNAWVEMEASLDRWTRMTFCPADVSKVPLFPPAGTSLSSDSPRITSPSAKPASMPQIPHVSSMSAATRHPGTTGPRTVATGPKRLRPPSSRLTFTTRYPATIPLTTLNLASCTPKSTSNHRPLSSRRPVPFFSTPHTSTRPPKRKRDESTNVSGIMLGPGAPRAWKKRRHDGMANSKASTNSSGDATTMSCSDDEKTLVEVEPLLMSPIRLERAPRIAQRRDSQSSNSDFGLGSDAEVLAETSSCSGSDTTDDGPTVDIPQERVENDVPARPGWIQMFKDLFRAFL